MIRRCRRRRRFSGRRSAAGICGTTNWSTFTEQSFSFRVTPDVVAQAMMLALLIGVLGGALPARRASRLSPQAALRTL